MTNDDRKTQQWIAAQGLNAKTFNSMDVRAVRAYGVAQSLLRDAGQMMTDEQAATLHRYMRTVARAPRDSKIAPQLINAVFNINASVHRRQFKQHRHNIKAHS